MDKIREIPPVRDTPSEYLKIEARIKRVFRDLVYLPLLKELKESPKILRNADMSPLLTAIAAGWVSYERGRFHGRFSAAVSAELKSLGAKFDKKTATWRLDVLPVEIVMGIEASYSRFAAKLSEIDKRLAGILPQEIAEKLHVADLFSSALFKVDRSLQATLKTITLIPKLADHQVKRISSEWQENMDLWIQNFAESEIKALRAAIRTNAEKGNRYEAMVRSIQKSYGVTANKAKFLARQETSLLMAKFKEVRYQDAGVHQYRWATVHMPKDKTPGQHTPGNVRYSHGILDGKIFRFDTPPVTTAPGEPERRNNPGQDYNCRCTAIPIIKFRE